MIDAFILWLFTYEIHKIIRSIWCATKDYYWRRFTPIPLYRVPCLIYLRLIKNDASSQTIILMSVRPRIPFKPRCEGNASILTLLMLQIEFLESNVIESFHLLNMPLSLSTISIEF